MRIAHLSKPWIAVPPAGYGGVERFIYNLANEQKGVHDVHVFATGDSHLPQSVTLHSVFDKSLGEKGLDRNYEVAQAAAFAVADRRHHMDILHVHSVEAFLATAPFLGKKSIFTFHTLPNDATRALAELAAPYVEFTFVSQQHRRQYPWVHRAHVVYPGIDMDKFPFSDKKRPYLAFVGSIADRKGILEAIEISRRCHMQLKIGAKVKPQDKTFYEESVKPLIDRSDHVTYLGEMTDMQRNNLLMHAAAMLFPVKWEEPFGCVVTESMAVGTPVVAFNRGAVGELVDHGQTGFVVDTIAEAVDAIGRLDTIDPYVCRQRVADYFSIKQSAAAFETLYESVAKSNRA